MRPIRYRGDLLATTYTNGTARQAIDGMKTVQVLMSAAEFSRTFDSRLIPALINTENLSPGMQGSHVAERGSVG